MSTHFFVVNTYKSGISRRNSDCFHNKLRTEGETYTIRLEGEIMLLIGDVLLLFSYKQTDIIIHIRTDTYSHLL